MTSNDGQSPIREPQKQLSFFDLGQMGHGSAGRYVVGFILIFGGSLVVTVFVALLMGLAGFNDALVLLQSGSNWVDIDPAQDKFAQAGFVLLMLSLIAILLLAIPVIRWLHKRPFKTVLTNRPKFDLKLALIAGGIFFALQMIFLIVGLVTDPDSLELIFDASRYWPFLILALLLTPFQCLAEEVLFRGYLIQGIGLVTAKTLWRLLLPSLLFVAVHSANGDMMSGGVWAAVTYFVLGLYLAWLAFRYDGLEASWGVHTANNLFVFTIATTEGAGMPFATIFYGPKPSYESGLIGVVIALGIHYWLLGRLTRSER